MANDKIVDDHLNYMLGASEANVAHAKAATDEIEVDRRITDAVLKIGTALNEADQVWQGLKLLGIPASRRLDGALDAIAAAADEIRRCQGDIVNLRFAAANQNTTNMMNAVLGAVQAISAADE